MRRLIVFLIRRRLGLRAYEPFQFVGQKSNAIYCFTDSGLMKMWRNHIEKSGVSLNWLLDDECEIRKVESE